MGAPRAAVFASTGLHGDGHGAHEQRASLHRDHTIGTRSSFIRDVRNQPYKVRLYRCMSQDSPRHKHLDGHRSSSTLFATSKLSQATATLRCHSSSRKLPQPSIQVYVVMVEGSSGEDDRPAGGRALSNFAPRQFGAAHLRLKEESHCIL